MRATLLAIGALFVTGCVEPQAKIAAFGDSVVWGYGGSRGGWVTDVENDFGHPIANLGIPGETAQTGKRRIAGPLGMVLAPAAKTVFLLEGGNDAIHFLHATPCGKHCDPDLVPEKFEALRGDLEVLRHRAAEDGRHVVFATYWPPSPDACSTQFTPDEFLHFRNFIRRANEILNEVAAENADPIVHLEDLDVLPGDPKNYYDCYHLSAKGYRIIATRWMADRALWAPVEDGTWDDQHH